MGDVTIELTEGEYVAERGKRKLTWLIRLNDAWVHVREWPGVEVEQVGTDEGAAVQKGDRLFALSAELQSAAMGATQVEIARRLSSQHESLAAEGFIHCSYEDQLDGVIERYYADRNELVILTIDTEKLSARLVAEPSTGGEIYPHIYGPLPLAAVLSVGALERTADGAVRWPAAPGFPIRMPMAC